MKSRRPVCHSKYLGATVRLSGRDVTVVGCSRPKTRPAPKKAAPRFRVANARGVERPVLRSRVYRAATCSAKPDARGCTPLDIERAPWLARRALDTSFDFGANADPPPSLTRGRRTEEMSAPRRLPSPAMLTVMQSETRELARWLAYVAPWAWDAVASQIAFQLGIDASTLTPVSDDERARRYGYGYDRGFGGPRVPRPAPRALITDSVQRPDFVARPSVEPFIRDVVTVTNAILTLESGVWSEVFERRMDDDGRRVVAGPRPTDPTKIFIPPRTHPSTAAAMRRRVAERNASEARAWKRAQRLLEEASGVVARWARGEIPAGIHALDREVHERRAENRGVEWASTWAHDGHDWRITVGIDHRVVVDRFDGQRWHRRWEGVYLLRHDKIDQGDAPPDVRAALAALGSGRGWQIARLFGGGREARRSSRLREFDRGGRRTAEGDDCIVPIDLIAAEGRDAWDLTRRIPCAASSARERLEAARDRELAVLCDDPLAPACEAFHALVERGCAPACGTPDDGACPYQITPSQMASWQDGSEPIPPFVFDTDRPHVVGSDACFFGPVMTARRRLHARVRAQTIVPDRVRSRGASAAERFVEDAIREAERGWPDPAVRDLWARADERILGRARARTAAHHVFHVNSVDDLSVAYLAALNGDYGPAYKLSDTYHTTGADHDVELASIADELWRYWVEEQKLSRGAEARIATMRRRHSHGGRFSIQSAAMAIAQARAGKGRRAEKAVR